MNNSEKLQALEGKTLNYKGVTLILQNISKVRQNYVLKTDKRTMVLNEYELTKFLQEVQVIAKSAVSTFKLPKDPKGIITPPNKETIQLSIYEATPAQKKVQEALLTCLEKVQKDKEWITQAKAVCDIANTMVNVERSQIELIKLSQNLK